MKLKGLAREIIVNESNIIELKKTVDDLKLNAIPNLNHNKKLTTILNKLTLIKGEIENRFGDLIDQDKIIK